MNNHATCYQHKLQAIWNQLLRFNIQVSEMRFIDNTFIEIISHDLFTNWTLGAKWHN